MFHIAGVDHGLQSLDPRLLQRNVTPRAQLEFAGWLDDKIARLNPTLLAEEQHIDWLGSRVSIPQTLASKAQIDHVFCDPGRKERQKLQYRDLEFLKQRLQMCLPDLSNRDLEVRATAIEIAREFPKREEFWLASLQSHDVSRAVFVCGDAHVEGFRQRLANCGWQSEVLVRGFGMKEYDRQLLSEAQLLLSTEPLLDVE
jgi:hypothetical protein